MKLTPLLLLFVLTAISHAGSLKFEKDLQEASIDLKQTTVSGEFKFTNTGSKPIKFHKVEPDCSCVTVEFLNGKAEYAAGESGVMRATFKIDNSQGTVDKIIGIWLEGDPEETPSSKVTFRIHIPIAIALEPKTVSWDVNSKPEPKSIRVKIDYEKPVHITKVSLSSENYTSEILPVEEGKTYDVRITPKSTAAQGICMVGIETDIDIDKFKKQQGFARVSIPEKQP